MRFNFSETLKNRSTVLSLISILHIISGFFLLAGLLFTIYSIYVSSNYILDHKKAITIALLILICALNIVAGIGIWRRKTWGWYSAASYYFYKASGEILSIILILNNLITRKTLPSNTFSTLIGQVLGLIFFSGLLFFFIDIKTINYFDKKTFSKFNATITIAIVLTFTWTLMYFYN